MEEADKGGNEGCSTIVAMDGGIEDGAENVNEGETFK